MRLIPIGLMAAAVASMAGAKPVPAPPPPMLNLSPPPVETAPDELPPPPNTGPRPVMPRTNPGYWVTADDYPTQSLRSEDQGTVSFRLTVDKQGRATGCEITGSSGYSLLDETTCSLMMRRSRFYPALDDAGDPVGGTWASRIRWQVPQGLDLPSLPVTGQSVIAFTIDQDGSPTNCELVSGPDPADFLPFTMPCNADTSYPVYTDAKGNPVARRVRMVISVSLPGAQPAARRKKRKP